MVTKMNRDELLDQWLKNVLGGSLSERALLSGDASFRRYYRVSMPGQRYVVMDAPPPEEPALFVELAGGLRRAGLNVPEVFAQDLSQGFLLLSDFGDDLYLSALNEKTASTLYQDAFSALLRIQQCVAEVPYFDDAFLKRQMEIFKVWFLEKNLKLSVTPEIDQELAGLLRLFSEVMKEQPQVLVHRDYHSRNLMLLESGNPGILDFQDAMKGPVTYDLVSLLQDCYVAWPRKLVENWVGEYQESAKAAGVLTNNPSRQTFLRWFDLTGLQRHLKNLGIFSRLYYRDGKAQYLKDIPMLYKYMQETVERYPELAAYPRLFDQILTTRELACVP